MNLTDQRWGLMIWAVAIVCGLSSFGGCRPKPPPEPEPTAEAVEDPVPVARPEENVSVPQDGQELLLRLAEFYADQKHLEVSVQRIVNTPTVLKRPDEAEKIWLRFARPNKLVLQRIHSTQGYEVVSDGATYTLSLTGPKRYRQTTAPWKLEELLDDLAWRGTVGRPDIFLWKLVGEKPEAALTANSPSLKYAGFERLNDELVFRLNLRYEWGEKQLLIAAVGTPRLLQVTTVHPYAAEPFTAPVLATAREAPLFKRNTLRVTVERYTDWKFEEPTGVAAKFEFVPPPEFTPIDNVWSLPDTWAEYGWPLVGRLMPPVPFTMADRKPFPLASLQTRRIVLLYFWNSATVAAPAELAALKRLSFDYIEKDLAVFGVNIGQTPQVANKFLVQNGLNIDLLQVPSLVALKPVGIPGLPTVLLIDRQGYVRRMGLGSQQDLYGEIQVWLDVLLAREKYVATLLAQLTSATPPDELVRALGSEDNRLVQHATKLLVERQAAAFAALGTGLEADDPQIRRNSVVALGLIGRLAAPLAGEIIKTLRLPDSALREKGRQALFKMGLEALPALRDGLADSDPTIRAQVALVISQLGTKASATIPVLVQNLGDPEEQVRDAIVLALGNLGPEALDALGAAMLDADEKVQVDACDALVRLGPRAVPVLIRTLESDKPHVRGLLAEAADKLPSRYAEQVKLALRQQESFSELEELEVPGLIERLGDKNAKIGRAAARELAERGTEAIEPLAAALRSPNRDVRLLAASALGQLGPDAVSTFANLMTIAGDPDPRVRVAVGQALGSLGPEVGPKLIKLASNAPDDRVRATVMIALGELGSETDVGLAALLDGLRTGSTEVRNRAAEGLGRLGAKSVEPLLAILAEDDPRVQTAAAAALGACGDVAVPALIQALGHASKGVRLWSAIALGKIGTEAKDAVPALTELTMDPDPDVRFYAATALKQISR